MKMALFGHSGSHTSQLMHSSVIIKAMVDSSPFFGQHKAQHAGRDKLSDIPAQVVDLTHQGARDALINIQGV
jgi:hypothetical protein